MGIYLQTPVQFLKAAYLEQECGAECIERPEHFTDVPEGKYLLCAVENPTFDAVGIAYNVYEFVRFSEGLDPMDRRRRTWLLIDESYVREQHPNIDQYIEEAPKPSYLLTHADRVGVTY